MLYVRGVQVLDGFWLRLTLSNGVVVERDVQDLIRGGVFEPLRRHRDLFAAAFVEGRTVAWPGQVDIAPETLIWDGPEPEDRSVSPKRRLRLHRVPRHARA
jgi:hypothetical protein